MAQSTVALGRPVGKVDTDPNGLARYSLHIEVPKGRGHGNEPNLSFEYSQGAPNGTLGVGWALGGMSAIRLGPAALAFDGINDAPQDFDPFVPRLTLDGNLLLNIQGEYFSPSAEYRTEIDSLGRTVSVYGGGFIVRDSTGKRTEYGTSLDSQSLTSDGSTIREWRVKKQLDQFGNCVTFNYEQAPEPLHAELQAAAASYLSTIAYTSNETVGLEAKRLVTFEYMARDDPVVQCVYGERIAWTRLLKAVHVGLARDPDHTRVRSYEVTYTTCPTSSASHVSALVEVGYKDRKSYRLRPTTFTYQGFDDPAEAFHPAKKAIVPLVESSNTVMAMNLNISGRGLADIASFSYDPSARGFSIQTFLAERTDEVVGHGPAITWQLSSGEGAEAQLPFIDLNYISKIFGADLNGDGRVDLIVPFEAADGSVHLSVSESLGTGFKHFKIVETKLPWNDNSLFKAVDLNGRGSCEVVHIYADGGNLSLRTYPSIENQDGTTLEPGEILSTDDAYDGTIEWLEIMTQKTGSKCLVRVWQEDVGRGLSQLKATTYSLQDPRDPAKGFVNVSTSLLGEASRWGDGKLSVLSCDINADGVEDIIACVVDNPGNEITFKFNTFLGDGLGNFAPIGSPAERSFDISEPPEEGSFHVANFLGSQAPELVYVYREAFSGDIVSFVAQGSSSGLMGGMKCVRVASNIPFESVKVSASDLNGSGVSDFFIHTVEEGTLMVMGVYNVNEPSNFLKSARSPLGLKTELTYASLSEPSVYQSSTKWDDFAPPCRDSHPILGASNLVVSSITHSNDAKENALHFQASLKKLYKNARSNRLGRGWQGFSNIVTTNFFGETEPVVVDEEFQQDFPLTGLKTKIDTGALSGPVMKSEKAEYGHSQVQLGQWKIFRIDRLSERTDMFDGETVGRTMGKDIVPDSMGNTLQKHEYEIQNGQLIHQSWDRFTYTTVNSISGLQTSRKRTSREENVDQSKYEEGDLSLTIFHYDSETGTLREALEWSSDVNAFATTKTEHDVYGNEICSLDASGLKVTTTYDEEYQALPIRVLHEGDGVSHSRLSAYDALSGLEVAHRDTNGRLTCYTYDAFGRCVQSKVGSIGSTAHQQPALEYLGSSASIRHGAMEEELTAASVHPQRSLRFESVTTSSGSTYLCTISNLEFSDGPSGRTEIVEVVNCTNAVCRPSSKQGEMPASWKYWDYNLQGLRILESFPMYLPSSVQPGMELDFAPDAAACTRITYNAISQPVELIRPGHSGTDHFIVTKREYLSGGATVRERRFRREAKGEVPDQLLSTTSKTAAQIAEQECITEIIDENGLKSTFVFDAAGRLIACHDAGGKVETRRYNARGQIVALDNPYQNRRADSHLPAISRAYDIAGRILSETNALGETTEYENDSKKRPIRKVGHDKRTLVYKYDENGLESLSSVTTYPSQPQPEAAFETRVCYEYDGCGRATMKSLTFDDGTSYSTSLSYNWQDNVVKTTLPDGAVMSKQWQGGLLSSTDAVCPPSQQWNVTATIDSYNALEKPEAYQIAGADFSQPFSHRKIYDEQGFPLSHTLTAGVPLVQNHYIYGDLDQLQRVHEFGSGQTIDYTYSGKRLSSSQIGTGPVTSYAYDDSGNMTARGTTHLRHDAMGISGITDGSPAFEVEYDGAGRMVRRQTPNSHFSFAYNGFGDMASMTDVAANETTRILSDDEGLTVKRVRPDGGQEVFVSKNYTVIVKPSGERSVRYALFNQDELLATVTMDQASSSAQSPSVAAHYCDTKNNVTHTFNAEDQAMRTRFGYDDYGFLQRQEERQALSQDDYLNTYEGRPLDEKSGLVDFGSRWYDPLACRFATPDDVTDPALLLAPDGINRHAFENNDPANHVDPSGHWSLNATLGILAGVALIGAGILLVAATGGAAAPVLAVIAKAGMIAGGVAGVVYSVEHSNEDDSGKFWGGWGMTVGVNAAVGALTAGIGAAAGGLSGYSGSMARLATAPKAAVDSYKYKAALVAARVAGKALLSGAGAAATKTAARAIGNSVYGRKDDVWGSTGKDFLMGFGSGLLSAGASEFMGRYGDNVKDSAMGTVDNTVRDRGFSNVHAQPGEWQGFFKNAGSSVGGGAGGGGLFNPGWTNPFGH